MNACIQVDLLLTGKHSSDGQNFTDAVKLAGCDKGSGQRRLQRELGHDDSHLRQIAVIIQSSQVIQVLESLHQRFRCFRDKQIISTIHIIVIFSQGQMPKVQSH